MNFEALNPKPYTLTSQLRIPYIPHPLSTKTPQLLIPYIPHPLSTKTPQPCALRPGSPLIFRQLFDTAGYPKP